MSRLPSRLGGPMNPTLQSYLLNIFVEHVPELYSLDPNLHFDENYTNCKHFWRTQ